MKRLTIAVLAFVFAAGCEPKPTRIEDIDLAKLEGAQADCASRAARAAMRSFSDDTAWTDLMSVDGAAEAVTTITNATQTELQTCIADIYLMGIEDGRVLEREVY